jgi:hypothetical protein
MTDRSAYPLVAILLQTGTGKPKGIGGLALSRVPCVGELIRTDTQVLVVTHIAHDGRSNSETDASVQCVEFGSQSAVKWTPAG